MNDVLYKLLKQISDIPKLDSILDSIQQLSLHKALESHLKKSNVNVLLVGGSGSGKSSTINALFNEKVTEVGFIDPVTKTIECYKLDNLVLWDTPGLGDGLEDDSHKEKIATKLREKDPNGELLIDMVLVIIDGSSRDLNSAYDVINNTIIPNLGDDSNRLLVALNQADLAGKNKRPYIWNDENNSPSPELEKLLKDKVSSIKQRIEETSHISITEPIYYSACAGKNEQPYNLSNLFLHIMRAVEKPDKRLLLAVNTNQNKSNWEYNSLYSSFNLSDNNHTQESSENKNQKNFREQIHKVIEESIIEILKRIGGKLGETIGKFFGTMGEKAGKRVGEYVGEKTGGLLNAIKNVVIKVFSWF